MGHFSSGVGCRILDQATSVILHHVALSVFEDGEVKASNNGHIITVCFVYDFDFSD